MPVRRPLISMLDQAEVNEVFSVAPSAHGVAELDVTRRLGGRTVERRELFVTVRGWDGVVRLAPDA
jgi:hypothetical protein